jgi:hypothetical protein
MHYRPMMKRLLRQETSIGPLYIVKDEELYRVLWFGRRLGSAATIEGAIRLASGQSLGGVRAQMPEGVVADPDKWILTKS